MPENLCDLCESVEGVMHSRYWKDDFDEGAWVCEDCERDLQESYEEWLRDMRWENIEC